jgi:hypothetical protein
MRVKRMVLILPPRLRSVAEHEARRIAQESAAGLALGPGGTSLRIDVPGRGLSGHALSAAVGQAMAAKTGGRG